MADFPSFPTDDYFSRLRWGPGVEVAISAGAASITSALSAGHLYVIVADVPWHWQQGPHASGTISQVAASTSDVPLGAYAPKFVWVWDVDDTANRNDAVSGKAVSASGSFWYAKVKG